MMADGSPTERHCALITRYCHKAVINEWWPAPDPLRRASRALTAPELPCGATAKLHTFCLAAAGD